MCKGRTQFKPVLFQGQLYFPSVVGNPSTLRAVDFWLYGQVVPLTSLLFKGQL